MPAQILGMGTATPSHPMSQSDAARMFDDIVCGNERERRKGSILFRKSEVNNRYTCVPHTVAYNWCRPDQHEHALTLDDLTVPPVDLPNLAGGSSPGPSTSERMELYSRFASDLAIDASRQALQASTCSPQDITHLITVSCTGFVSPGVDIDLIRGLDLPARTQRIHVGFMGCHGAINGMRAALGVTAADPHAKVLLTAVELCSLHYRFQWDDEGIVGNALFADGSASLVLENDNPVVGANGSSATGWRLVDTDSVLIPESREAMSWRVGDRGFEMLLSSEVAEHIGSGLHEWLTEWLSEHELALSDVNYWGVHPGGPRILTSVEEALALKPAALATSRSVLAEFGNMSSPTVLFILKEFSEQNRQRQAVGVENSNSNGREHCLLLAFGPGLVAEVALLRRDG